MVNKDVAETIEKMKPDNRKAQAYLLGFFVTTMLMLLAIGVMGIVNSVNGFFEDNRAYFQNPIIIEKRPLFVIEKKELPIGETRDIEGVELQPEDSKPVSSEVTPRSWTGQASYYSFDGCLGCSPTRTMANGQILDDSNYTVAFNFLPLGSKVEIKNITNGESVVAEVTDTGGFTKLGRIADLTVATKNAINCSDLCNVKVTEIE